MKTYNLKEKQAKNLKRRELAINGIRKNLDPDFYLGKRVFDRPRKNPEKQRVLDSLK